MSRRFGGLKAVTGVSFPIEAGRITGLIGPNGAGKTTLVNLVTGLLRLDEGAILLDGEDIAALEPHAVARRGLARTFQNIRLLPEQTVVENVMIGFHVRERAGLLSALLGVGAARSERRDTAAASRQLVDRFGLAPFANDLAGGLSYGHQRRVEMARALAAQPRVLLLDEPVAGMNDVEAASLGRIFRELATEGVGIVVIEHNMAFVMGLCDELVVLDGGVVLARGAPATVAADPAVVAAYLGTG